MTTETPKEMLHRYLRLARAGFVWKLDGLSEYDVRRPMVPTATNLLGLVKHVASVELGYFSFVFDRPSSIPLPWLGDGAAPNADMWVTADESRADIMGLYEQSNAHADATIDALDLDARGRVPWWGDRGEVTLQLILVHMIAETNRHAGQADIVRELIDGSVGMRPDLSNLPDEVDEVWWGDYRSRVQAAADHHRNSTNA